MEEKKITIGSHEVTAVLGNSIWKTPYDVWKYKLDPKTKFEGNEYTEAGELFEPIILDWFEKKTSFQKLETKLRFDSGIFVGIADRICLDLSGDKCIVEAKNTTKEIDQFNLPIEWIDEVQLQMRLSGINKTYVCWLSKGVHFGYAIVHFDADYSEQVKTYCEWWYNEYIVNKIAPPPIGNYIQLYTK